MKLVADIEFSLPMEDLKKLKKVVEAKGVSLDDYVQRAIMTAVKKDLPKKKSVTKSTVN